jgi:hypothetical protein
MILITSAVITSSTPRISFEEKAYAISKLIYDELDNLYSLRWHERVDTIMVAVLLVKMGGRRVCGCPDV